MESYIYTHILITKAQFCPIAAMGSNGAEYVAVLDVSSFEK